MQRSTLFFAMAAGVLVILNLPETEARMTLAQLTNAMKGISKSCISKTGVSPEIVAQTKNGVFPPDRDLQCYYQCLLIGMKVHKDGKLLVDAIFKSIDMMMPLDIVDRSKEVTQMCNDLADGADACERSWQFVKCYYETEPTIYFFP